MGLGAAGLATVEVPVAQAAFEWTHASPRSWMLGIEDARWPVPEGALPAAAAAPPARPAPASRLAGGPPGAIVWHAAVQLGHPWSWSGLEAHALRAGFTRRRWGLHVGLAQLRAAGYRESRPSCALALRTLPGQWLVLGWSALALGAEPAQPVGHELALGWQGAAGAHRRWRLAVVALGAWRSAAAIALAAPRALVLSGALREAPLQLELQWRERPHGSFARLGLAIAATENLRINAGIASREPQLRWGLELALAGVELELAFVHHAELPVTRVIGLGWRRER